MYEFYHEQQHYGRVFFLTCRLFFVRFDEPASSYVVMGEADLITMEENFIKVIKATYKLLDFFPDNDPLKIKSKEKALEILQNLTLTSEIEGWTSLKKERASVDLLDDIEVLKNYLQLGKHQGWIGGINFLILLKELDRLKSRINPMKSVLSGVLQVAEPTTRVSLRESKPLIPENKITPKIQQEKTKLELKNTIDESILLQPHLPKTTDEGSKNKVRKEKILDIINNMGKAQVSDIIKEIPHVTKRTIRRDLDELLKKSKIVRNGEWNEIFYQMG